MGKKNYLGRYQRLQGLSLRLNNLIYDPKTEYFSKTLSSYRRMNN
jgi:hypothetical protein